MFKIKRKETSASQIASKYISFPSFLAIILLFSLQACKKSKSDLGKALFTETGNKVFKNMDSEAYTAVFQKKLAEQKKQLSNPKLITAYYSNNDYEPVIVLQHLKSKGLATLLPYLEQSGDHGLAPRMFQTESLKKLIGKLYDNKGISTTDEAYETLAELELVTANALINYTNALQYGMISPKRIYGAYYTDTKRPDSSSMNRIFAIKDLKIYLDSIQPKDPQYRSLQAALKGGEAAPGMTKEQTHNILKVNLERLRWKNKPAADKYVIVNIPDFKLQVIEKGSPVLEMKVCVGEGRPLNPGDNFKEFDENDLKKDRPFSRETPQLNSLIHSVQVNPVWNIPESIATNEITKYAAADRFYLSSHNIDVFENGKLIEDTETIDWSDGNPGKKYTFKQRPGDDNSLGKIKFLFNNQSAVYLHDTPAKAAFAQSMRAVSHGCVRLEKPLELAYALFGAGAKYDDIKKRMESPEAEAKDISLPKKVPVYLTYTTACADKNNVITFRKDVYGLDLVLYSYMKKLGAGE